MQTAKITFHKLIQDSQDFGSNDDHMISRAFFSLQIGGTLHRDLFVSIKQTVGGASDHLEVGQPQGYSGPFDHAEFSKAVEKYFHGLVGPKGSGFRIAAGSVRMKNNTFVSEMTAELIIPSA